VIDTITYQDFKNFKNEYFRHSRQEWIVSGNVTRKLALELVNGFEAEYSKLYNHKTLAKD
jgi:hypothetical protein